MSEPTPKPPPANVPEMSTEARALHEALMRHVKGIITAWEKYLSQK